MSIIPHEEADVRPSRADIAYLDLIRDESIARIWDRRPAAQMPKGLVRGEQAEGSGR
ncbi:hypothetical protein [Microtetraspora malaysiensis]|uniref:Uncharacterized protein n=1 Tax=Microtetraspora malaysiensis TaxID=161358 RepID=A0ABW6T7B5_9ACTN